MADFFKTVSAHRGREPLISAWGIDGAFAGARALYNRQGALYRDPGFPAVEIPDAPLAQPEIHETPSGRLFLEPLGAGRRLVVCGAGHVSLPLIRLALTLDFEVAAIDDREAFADRARLAGARRVLCEPFPEALDETEGGPSTAFVVMTREHAHDLDCLRRVLKKPWAYAGMMGSRGRSALVRRQLLEEGFDAGALQRVRMPIGLPIGSRTPEEIAVSIAAELIQVMNASDAGEGYPPGMLEALSALEDEPEPRAVLAMIVEKTGEAPRRPGAKLLLKPDGRFLGTVGGGAAEAVILKAAGGMLREGRREPRLARVSLEKGTMYCGGEIAALLLPL